MTDSAAADAATKTGPVFVLVEGETTLDCPVDKAWSHVIDFTSWQIYSIAEPVSGVAGQEGEIVLLKKEEGVNFPPYYARTILLEPGTRVIWKTYPQETRPGNDYFGFVDFAVEPQGRGTRFRYRFLYELQVAYREEADLNAIRRQMIDDTRAMLDIILPKLKTLAEAK